MPFRHFLPLLMIFPLTATAGSKIGLSCTKSDLPSGRYEKFILSSWEDDFALVHLSRNPRSGEAQEVLATELRCVQSAKDPLVVNCLRPAIPGSNRKADAQLTNIRHTFLSAGPLEGGDPDRIFEMENYTFYFRDDRGQGREIKWNPLLAQCSFPGPRDLALFRQILTESK